MSWLLARITALRKSRQSVIELNPRQATACPGMGVGPHARGIVEACQGEVDLSGKLLRLKRKLCATGSAKGASAVIRRWKGPRCAFQQDEAVLVDGCPGDKGRASGATTNRAVAVPHIAQCPKHFISDGPASATTLQSLLFVQHVENVAAAHPGAQHVLSAVESGGCSSSAAVVNGIAIALKRFPAKLCRSPARASQPAPLSTRPDRWP